jgi:hypothetical protein
MAHAFSVGGPRSFQALMQLQIYCTPSAQRLQNKKYQLPSSLCGGGGTKNTEFDLENMLWHSCKCKFRTGLRLTLEMLHEACISRLTIDETIRILRLLVIGSH